MEVIVQTERPVTGRSSLGGEIGEVLREFAVELEPLHPRVDDETLRTYYVIHAPDARSGDQIAERLRRCRGIAAAYVKPPSEEPS